MANGTNKILGIYIGNNDAECQRLNWTLKIEAMQKLIDCWRTRYLTLQGKILIIKSIVLPKIIFSASLLSTPDGVIKDINKILYKFIWGKTERLQRDVLINEYEEGGLCMIDVESHFKALKATWIERIHKETNDIWKHLPRSYIKHTTNNLIMEMSCLSIKQMPILHTIPQFYQEVILGYCKSNLPTTIDSKSKLFSQILWGNRLLVVHNTCLFSKSFIDAGYIYVRDILQENGKFKDGIYQSLTIKAKYFRIIDLISCALKPYKVHRFSDAKVYFPKAVTSKVEKKSKWFYKHIVKEKRKKAKCIRKWSDYFNHETCWSHVYENKLNSQFEVKIAEFNYKMLNNILPTGDNLYKWKKVPTPNCIYCGFETHNLQHLFWDCSHLNSLWNIISSILNIEITWELLVIGTNKNKNFNTILSLICFIVYKRYLCNKEKPDCFPNLSNEIVREIEYRLQVYSNVTCSHETRTRLQDICNMLTTR